MKKHEQIHNHLGSVIWGTLQWKLSPTILRRTRNSLRRDIMVEVFAADCLLCQLEDR